MCDPCVTLTATLHAGELEENLPAFSLQATTLREVSLKTLPRPVPVSIEISGQLGIYTVMVTGIFPVIFSVSPPNLDVDFGLLSAFSLK